MAPVGPQRRRGLGRRHRLRLDVWLRASRLHRSLRAVAERLGELEDHARRRTQSRVAQRTYQRLRDMTTKWAWILATASLVACTAAAQTDRAHVAAAIDSIADAALKTGHAAGMSIGVVQGR